MIKHLQVETTNICNAHCIFCPHDRYNKSYLGIMSDEIYRKIIEDASQYNLISFAPMLTGEPFCDPGIIERIKLARNLMPDTIIRLFTNGSLMKQEHIDELAEIAGIELNISLNGQNRERRLEMMGLDDYEEILKKIEYIESKGIRFNLTAVWHPVYSIDQVNKFLRLPNSSLIRFQSFAGWIYRYNRKNPTKCNRVTEYLTILWTGQVNLCCFDVFGEVYFGNLKHQTIDEVWNSQKHMEYLRAHKVFRGQEMALCKYCTEGA